MSEPEWITTVEAAELSGYHPEYIRELLREERVSGRKFGRTWMVDKQSITDYVQYVESRGERRGPKPQNQ